MSHGAHTLKTFSWEQVELPALQWVDGLIAWIDDFQHKASGAGAMQAQQGGEPRLFEGCDVEEMRQAQRVLRSWQGELLPDARRGARSPARRRVEVL